jgi:hypothetical protein
MSSVTFDVAVGGDGSTVTDDDNASTGLREGGWKTRFVPALTQEVAVAGFVVTKANEAAQSAVDATNNGAAQVVLAADQVALATTQAGLATTNGAAQVTLATTQANNAAASYDAFDDRYLGSKSTPPTLDNDGNALLTGAIYWNSVSSEMRAWDGSAWLASYLPASGYLQNSDIGITVEAYDATILKDADIGVSVLAPNGSAANLTDLPAGGDQVFQFFNFK